MRKKTYLAAISLFAVLFCGFLFWGLEAKNNNNIRLMPLDKTIPAFQLTDLITQKQLTHHIFTGKVTLLTVWASWCSTCEDEIKVLNQLTHSMTKKDKQQYQFVGLNYKDIASKSRFLLNNLGNPFTSIIYDPEGEFATSLGVIGTPETWIVNEKGIAIYRYIGFVTQDIWTQLIEPKLLILLNVRES